MKIFCDEEGKKVIDNLINTAVGAGGFKDIASINEVLKSIKVGAFEAPVEKPVEEEKVEEKKEEIEK